MRNRAAVTALVLAATAVLMASVAPCPASVAHRRAPSRLRMLLTFDQHESLRRGTLVHDASGHRNGGLVHVRKGGELRPVAGWSGRGAAFPSRCCGRAIVEVHDDSSLDPRHRRFLFGAAVKLGPVRARVGSNVVQKGYFNQAGGQYKLQLLPGGAPSCVVYGHKGRVILNATTSVADQSWHRLTCLRTPTRVQLRIDGKVVAGAAHVVGYISNNAPLRVGGNKVKPGNQQYRGAIDSVFLRYL
jgi:hypothetical protein